MLTSNGEILTNNHVVDGATKISVTDIGNGKTYAATVVGYDLGHDIAVLQLQGASGLKTAQLATSKPSVGEAVVAIGNAGGTGGTPTSAGGSVTALGQSITASDELTGSSEQLSGLIEVNSNVEAGDSGGPLVNAAGQVIGMDTAASQSFAFSAQGNAGFAIPISTAIPVAKDIEAGQAGATVHIGSTAFLGVLIGSTDDSPFSGQYAGGGNGASHRRRGQQRRKWRAGAGRGSRRRGHDHFAGRADRNLPVPADQAARALPPRPEGAVGLGGPVGPVAYDDGDPGQWPAGLRSRQRLYPATTRPAPAGAGLAVFVRVVFAS